MPSTYSSSLRLELQASGENANTWGTKTNNNLNLIEQAIAGYSKITLASASATYTLPIADASASEGRNAFIEFAGTVASAISVIVPEVEKGYWVRNSATGSTLTVRTSAGTGVTLPTNEWVFLISDGVSVYSTLPTSLTNYARLNASQTFTGANTFTSAVTINAATSVAGSFQVSGAASFASAVTVSGPATFASLVDIKGSTSIASTLFVAGTGTFGGAVSVSGDLWVKNNLLVTSIVDIGGRLQVTGESRLNNVSAAGALNVTQTFLVSGAATLSSAVDIKGPASLASTLIVAGTATFNSTVSIDNLYAVSTTFSSLNVSGGAKFGNTVSVSGSFTVSGTSRLVGRVSAENGLYATSALFIRSQTTAGGVGIYFNSLVSGPYGNIDVDFTGMHFTNFRGYTFETSGQDIGFRAHTTITSEYTLNVYSNRSVIINAGGFGLTTGATDGFLYIPSCSGVPTGTPGTAGYSLPIVIDRANHRLYFYSGGSWRNAGP
jgi:cytoskeletal protein CcmA (bactofilin family)